MQIKYRVIVAVVLIAVLALAWNASAIWEALPFQKESFTELWILGPQHKTENFPFNISRGESYDIFLGVSNHLGRCAYYSVQVKFRNLTQPKPDRANHIASSLRSLYEVRAFVADGEDWEVPVTFSFSYSYDPDSSRIRFSSLGFNGGVLDLSGSSTSWDSGRDAFPGDLVFELWIYNDVIGGFEFHDRYVDLNFNMTI